MFTSGVVSIFEDVFVLAGIIAIMMKMNWKLALITLRASRHCVCDQDFSRQGARFLPAHPHRHRAD